MDSELSKIQRSSIVLSPLITEAFTRKPTKALGERKKAVLRQELMVLLGNTCVVAAGMSVALPSVSLSQLTSKDDIYQLNTEQSSWFASINSMACPIGGLIVGYLMDRFGRKKTMLLNNFVGILGWVLLVTAPYQSSKHAIFLQLLIGRFVSGLMMGAGLSPIGAYSAEISLPRLRGRLILGTAIAIGMGVLLMYVMGFVLRNQFQLICLISAIYQCIAFCSVLLMPESPSWLLQKSDSENARKSLKYFRGLSESDKTTYGEFEKEFAVMKKTSDESRNEAANESLLQAVRSREVYRPLIVVIGLFFFQQFSGIDIIIVFASLIAANAGVSTDPMLVAIFIGIARIITTFFMSTIIERWGRRPAGMLSATGMTICMFLLAANGWCPVIGEYLPLLPIMCIVFHIIFSTFGLHTLPYLMISELYPQRVRGSASGFTIFVGLTLSFGIIKLYPTVELLIGTPNCFACFALMTLLGLVFIIFVVPETKGRTLLEIENYFRAGRHVTNAQVDRRESQIAIEVSSGV